MKKWLYWFSWLIYLISAGVILLGAIIALKFDIPRGLLYIFAGFIGLALSGLLMTIAYEVPGT